MGCLQSAPALHAYYSTSGELVSFERPKKHSAKREYQYVQLEDAKRFRPNDECYLLCTSWHESWLDFVLKRTKMPPPAIDNLILLENDMLRPNAKPKKDFRPINRVVWEYFFTLYGGGPVILMRVPEGFTEEEYLKGLWLRKVVFDQLVTIVRPSSQPTRLQLTQNTTTNPLSAAPAADLAARTFSSDLASKKLEQAKQLQTEIDQANVEAVGMLINKDRGRKMLKEAKEKEEKAKEAASHEIAHQFSANLAEKQLKDAQLARQQAEESQRQQAAAVLAAGNLKSQFRAALKTKNMKLMNEYAARILQNAWTGRKARKHVRAMKLERERLMRDGYARKLQSRYRAHLAKKRVARLRQEKERLRQEGAAIMLQSAWRMKKAREKVAQLRAEKRRLLEEFAALKVQCAWRIRRAKQQLGLRRAERTAQVARRSKAATFICKAFRSCRAQAIKRRLLQQSRLVFRVRLNKAEDVMVADTNSSDPYVYVHIDQPPLGGHVEHATHKRSVSSVQGDGGHTWSLYRSKVVYNTLNPVWEEDCLAVVNPTKDSLSHLCKLAFTVMDKDNFTADDFLGQTVISLEAHALQLYAGEEIVLHKAAIGGLLCPLRDAKGKQMAMQNTQHNGKGYLYASIRMAKPWKSFHGWIQKQASQKLAMGLGHTQFKPRFVVLMDGVLSYYEDMHSLEHPRGTISTSQVTTLAYFMDKSGEPTLQIKTASEDWLFHWMDGEEREHKLTWLRRLQYNCTHCKMNGQSRPLEIIIKNIPALVDSVNTEATTTPKKAARRVSSFFGSG